jgi:hypothetical protein
MILCFFPLSISTSLFYFYFVILSLNVSMMKDKRLLSLEKKMCEKDADRYTWDS